MNCKKVEVVELVQKSIAQSTAFCWRLVNVVGRPQARLYVHVLDASGY
jgi:hypothetical protein